MKLRSLLRLARSSSSVRIRSRPTSVLPVALMFGLGPWAVSLLDSFCVVVTSESTIPSQLSNLRVGRVHRLHQFRRFDLAPCAVANGKHPHGLQLLIDFIDDPINVRLLAVKQVPPLSFPPSCFRGNRAALGKRSDRIYRLPTRCTTEQQHATPWRSFPYKGFQGREPRERQTQRGMSCLRRISSNTSLAGRVRLWATSSSPWRMPSSASALAATSSRR